MHRIFRVKAYEKEHGPHFNEEYARKAVMKMENEDGTRGPQRLINKINLFYFKPVQETLLVVIRDCIAVHIKCL